MRWLDDITDSTDMNLSKLQSMGCKELDTTWRLNNNNVGTVQGKASLTPE